MLTKIVYDKYWRSWFFDDYKASSGEEAKNFVGFSSVWNSFIFDFRRYKKFSRAGATTFCYFSKKPSFWGQKMKVTNRIIFLLTFLKFVMCCRLKSSAFNEEVAIKLSSVLSLEWSSGHGALTRYKGDPGFDSRPRQCFHWIIKLNKKLFSNLSLINMCKSSASNKKWIQTKNFKIYISFLKLSRRLKIISRAMYWT